MADDGESITIPVSWVGIDDLPIQFANQFLVQFQQPGEFFLTVGQLTPPPLLGQPDEQLQQLQEWAFIPVKPVVRLGINRQRLEELIKVLRVIADRFDEGSIQ